MYEIILSRQAARYLERLDRTVQQRIIDRLEQLAKNPLGPCRRPEIEPGGHLAYRLSYR